MTNHGKPVTIDGVEYPSMADAARALGISPQAVWLRANRDYAHEARRRWRQQHAHHVISSQPGDTTHRLTPDASAALIKDLYAMSIRELARKYGISTATVNYYRKKYREQ
jgi:transposase-like protein